MSLSLFINAKNYAIADTQVSLRTVAVWNPRNGLFEHGWQLAEMKKLRKQYQARSDLQFLLFVL
jgi:hypothetical protein